MIAEEKIGKMLEKISDEDIAGISHSSDRLKMRLRASEQIEKYDLKAGNLVLIEGRTNYLCEIKSNRLGSVKCYPVNTMYLELDCIKL